MEKYYTPNISEFHIGFEYEEFIKSPDNNREWLKKQCTSLVMLVEELDYKIDTNLIRVKYLDKQDIENKGFVFNKIQGNCSKFIKYECFDVHWNEPGWNIILYKNNENSNIRLSFLPINISEKEDKEGSTIFQGKVLNINDFSRLLKQLNIR